LPRRLIVGEQAGAEEAGGGGVGVEVSELVFESFTRWAFNFDANCSSVRTHWSHATQNICFYLHKVQKLLVSVIGVI
jgi:hypothetical protein